jgi:uncharacterized protein YjbJ (UPF0337 family)
MRTAARAIEVYLQGGAKMNEDVIKGKWKEIKGGIKEKWGKLTDDEITQVEGKQDQLLGLLQKKYGYSKDQAEQEYKQFMAHYDKPSSTSDRAAP